MKIADVMFFIKKKKRFDDLMEDFAHDYITFYYGEKAKDIGIDTIEYHDPSEPNICVDIGIHCYEVFDGGDHFWLYPTYKEFVLWANNREKDAFLD